MTRFLPFRALALSLLLSGTSFAAPGRTTVSLDGLWQAAEGSLTQMPARFDHSAPVPGLIDLATPPFESPGSFVASEDRRNAKLRPADPRREAFWYRRSFRVDGPLPAVALLKVNKAKYGTKVFVNGQSAGEHSPNFTPGWFDLRPHLKADGAENELVIRVGASLAQVPAHVAEGWDFEKSRYIPGIYDSVELTLSGSPHIVNVQTVPQIPGNTVRAVVELGNAGAGPVQAAPACTVREAKSGKVVAKSAALPVTIAAGGKAIAGVTLPIEPAHLWTPEDPFLYELEVDTGADRSVTRFGMRSFRFDPETGRALLNGKPYFLRGSNVCMYRFFEDGERGALPWDEAWVRKLHRRFKEMHWNSLRYCIGFPPEKWYQIADEEGILIQDEFPVWYGGAKDAWPGSITEEHLAAEYTQWMRDRWNHPCVVIWDAQNETTDDRILGPVIQRVRGLDLSGRPWDNGWGTPQQAGDVSEAHPYRSNRPDFQLSNFSLEDGVPDNGPRQGAKPPYLINEYGWLWVNRNGTLPTLTTQVYLRELGPDSTVEQRRHYYARMLAAKTEFWRGRRRCAGVLHFCGLGYSRNDGQTSDHFVDVKNLVYEPEFFQYVRDAFAPVGVMLDFWETEVSPGASSTFPVQGLNDLESSWTGSVRLRLLKGEEVLWEKAQALAIPAWDIATAQFDAAMPAELGSYTLEAALLRDGHTAVRSLRDLTVAPPPPANLALHRPVQASSQLRLNDTFYAAALAVDGKSHTRWSSEFSDPQWLAVDLGEARKIASVELVWERAASAVYAIEVSLDGSSWKVVARNDKGTGKVERVALPPAEARWVRLRSEKRTTPFGVSLWEMRVIEEAATAPDR